jgi:hypothetical protein
MLQNFHFEIIENYGAQGQPQENHHGEVLAELVCTVKRLFLKSNRVGVCFMGFSPLSSVANWQIFRP